MLQQQWTMGCHDKTPLTLVLESKAIQILICQLLFLYCEIILHFKHANVRMFLFQDILEVILILLS